MIIIYIVTCERSSVLWCTFLVCSVEQIRCDDNLSCFNQDQWCDGYPNCRDASDEKENCSKIIPSVDLLFKDIYSDVGAFIKSLC